MKNFLKTLGVILIILGTYLFVVNVINKGGYQILIGAATGAMYIFFLNKTLNKNPPDKEAEQSSTSAKKCLHIAMVIDD